MSIAELYRRGSAVFSFEFFPPRTDKGYESLYRTVEDLKRLNPDFVSVTWGAGGSTRRKTVEIVTRIQRDIGVRAMAHLSCIGSAPDQIRATLDELRSAGIDNILALGGDRPDDYEPPPGAFTYANELAAFILEYDPGFCLGGACYPETHPLAESPEADLRNLVRKVEAGVDFLITQLFFDNRDYFDFCRRARDAGVEVPIVPGIMPILNAASIRRMTTLSGAKIPGELEAKLAEAEDDDGRTGEVGVEWATMQCRELLDRGVPGIHFYTLNKSQATQDIFQNLLRGVNVETLRIAVLLSGSGTSLENLLERIDEGSVPGRVEIVISSKQKAFGLERARRRDIPAVAVPRKQYPEVGAFNDALHAVLGEYEVDLVLLLGFLSPFETRGKFDDRTLNVHPSLIPAFCGAGLYGERVHRAVLEAGVKRTGATVHFVDAEYDQGPIVLQEAVAVRDDDTPESLAQRVQAAERRLIPQAVRLFATNRLQIEGRKVHIR